MGANCLELHNMMENLPLGPRSYSFNLPATYPLYREEQDPAVGQRPAQQPQEISHHTKTPERQRQGETRRERCATRKDTK